MYRSAVRTLAALTLALALLCSAALAAPGDGTVEVALNGFVLPLDHPARGEEGVTLAPVEELCAAIGATGWFTHVREDYTPIQAGLSYWWAEDGSNTFFACWDGGEPVTVTAGKEGARMEEGTLWAPLRPFAQALGFGVEWDGRALLTRPREEVTVSTLEELFNAVGHNTTLRVAEGAKLDFSTLDWTKVDNPFVVVEQGVDTRDPGMDTQPSPEAFDVTIQGVQDLTITGPAVFSTPWAYADVLKFRDCRRIALEGLTAVHEVEPGFCVGDCLALENCQGVRAVDCTLDGSGAYGLHALDCRDISLEGCTISHCTYGAVTLTDCAGVELVDCALEDCQGIFDLVGGVKCAGIRIKDSRVQNCWGGSLAFFSRSSGVTFEGCAFSDSGFGSVNGRDWDASGGAMFLECAGLEDCV